jgi:hypothetical protein
LKPESVLPLVRALAIAHLVGAAGICLFWIGFYTGVTFPRDVLEQKIPHFEAYYAFEKSFTVGDLTTAAVATYAAVQLLRDPNSRIARILIAGVSGALIFLTMLDVSYDLRNGMYDLGGVSLEFLAVPLLGLLGAATLAYMIREQLTHRACSGGHPDGVDGSQPGAPRSPALRLPPTGARRA